MALACGWVGDRAQLEIVLAEAAITMKPWPSAALEPEGGLTSGGAQQAVVAVYIYR
jgi:hypothetical protein